MGDGDEELVTIPQYGENRPLLGGPNAMGSGAQGNATAGNSGCKSYNSLDAPIPLAKEHQDSQSTAWNSIAKRLHPVFCFAFLFVCGSIVSIQRIQVNKLQQYKENPLQSAFHLTSLASNCPVQWQTYSTPKVREDIPSFPSYLSYNCQPIEVTYDKRSLRLNDQPVIFLSGSIHPARETATTWERALDQAVAGGMNMITMYVVWSAHQPSRNESMNWSFPESTQSSSPTAAVPTWDLSSAITSAGSRGLFVHLRIGPYICAEYDYGGIPEWVPANSKMNMRRPNAEWMKAMSTYVNETVKYITQNHLWSHQGGPIVIGQIENEIGGEVDPETEKLVPGTGKGEFAAMQDYADWSGRLAEEVAPNVTWTMCNGLTAPNCIK